LNVEKVKCEQFTFSFAVFLFFEIGIFSQLVIRIFGGKSSYQFVFGINRAIEITDRSIDHFISESAQHITEINLIKLTLIEMQNTI